MSKFYWFLVLQGLHAPQNYIDLWVVLMIKFFNGVVRKIYLHKFLVHLYKIKIFALMVELVYLLFFNNVYFYRSVKALFMMRTKRQSQSPSGTV